MKKYDITQSKVFYEYSHFQEHMSSSGIEDCIIYSNEGSYLDISVSPDSSKYKIKGINIWRNNLEIEVKERAKDGEANKAVVKFLSETLNIPTNKIEIVKGKTSKQKRVFFESISSGELKNKLEKMIS